jgi:glycosyltransferase involved in cell wall biosynthesis
MKIAMVTGSYPPNVCGAGDYTERLVTSLQQRGLSVEVITGGGWGLHDAPAVLKRINACGADITHLQYPTVGYGRRLGPQLIALLQRGIVTIHEASQTHFLRRLSLFPLFWSRHLVFTNSFEQAYVGGLAPWVRARSSVIPIGSNVSVGRADGERRLDEIIYFGLIRPAKGLEQVLDLAGLLKLRAPGVTIRIVGLALTEHASYLDALRRKSADLPIVWNLGLSDDEAAQVLARAAIAYAPFPDGASERRGSLLALLSNGVATVTTRGAQTPSILEEAVEFAASPIEALSSLEALRHDGVRRKSLSEHGLRYAGRFSWPDIADRHIRVYESVVRHQRESHYPASSLPES